MKIEQVALITYTIRDSIQTPEGFRESMKKLADIGFKAVQISGMAHEVMPAEAIAAVCAENGLTICATHEPADMILDEPEKIVKRMQTLGTATPPIPTLPASTSAPRNRAPGSSKNSTTPGASSKKRVSS